MKTTEQRPTITIKLKPHLQDYIRYVMQFDGNVVENSMMVATSRSYLGRLIAPFLSYRPPDEPPLLPGPERNLFTFMIMNYEDLDVRFNTVWISERNQYNIQNIIESHFRVQFRIYADDKVRYLREEHTGKGSIKKTIIQFCGDMNIAYDDVTYDMIAKGYYRSRCKSRKSGIVPKKRMMIGQLFFLL